MKAENHSPIIQNVINKEAGNKKAGNEENRQLNAKTKPENKP